MERPRDDDRNGPALPCYGVSATASAEGYDRHVGRYSDALASAFARFVGVAAGMRVLDVGCGPGALARELARHVGASRVTAVDPLDVYADACRSRVPGVDVRIGVAEGLPLADDSFDAVLAQLVIQSLDDPPRAVREMCRVASPGAVVAACTWDFRAGMPLLIAYWSAAVTVDPDGARRAGADEANPRCTPDGLRTLWADAGLREVETGELSARAEYADLDDAWSSFEASASPSSAYCRSLDDERRAALRDEFRDRLGVADGPFELVARAWCVRGRTPTLTR